MKQVEFMVRFVFMVLGLTLMVGAAAYQPAIAAVVLGFVMMKFAVPRLM